VKVARPRRPMTEGAAAGQPRMTLTTGIFSVSVEVTDLDRAKAFYEDVLGCEVVMDAELWPGVRLVEVRPPGSPVLVALVTRESGLPVGVRYWTGSADAAHAALTAAGSPPDSEVLHLEGAPPMFTVADPDGNTVILLEGRPTPA